METLNQFITSQPFLAAVVFMIVGALLGAYVRESVTMFRNYMASRSKERAKKRMEEIMQEYNTAQFIADNPQEATFHMIGALVSGIFFMGGAIAILLFPILSIILEHVDDSFLGLLLIFFPLPMFIFGVHLVSQIAIIYRKSTVIGALRENSLKSLRKLSEKHNIEFYYREPETTESDDARESIE